MSRKKGVVETRAAACLLAALVAACVHIEPDPDPFGIQASGAPIPEGVDYLRAVQCGGLPWTLQAIEYRTTRAKRLSSMTGLYLEWARQLATQAGETPALTKPDMAASRYMILAASGGISPASKAQEIRATYPGDVKACSVMAAAADYDIVAIGG